MLDVSLSSFKGMKLDAIRAAYSDFRALAVASGKYSSISFDKLCEDKATPHCTGRNRTYDAKSWLLSAACAVGSLHSVTTFTLPSEETLSWGGFLGGEYYTDTTAADALIKEVLSRHR